MDKYLKLQEYVGLYDSGEDELAWTRSTPPPFEMHEDTIFVCIDAEVAKNDNQCATEIGIATFDTRMIAAVPTGKGARNWIKRIDSRHIIVKEYKNTKNAHDKTAAATNFAFGDSETKRMRSVLAVVKDTMSGLNSQPNGITKKRNIVLVLYGAEVHLNSLKHFSKGDPLWTMGTIHTADVQDLCSRSNTRTKLSKMLKALSLPYEDLNNAGNRATHILQGLLRMIYFDTFCPADFATRFRHLLRAPKGRAQVATPPGSDAGVPLNEVVSGMQNLGLSGDGVAAEEDSDDEGEDFIRKAFFAGGKTRRISF